MRFFRSSILAVLCGMSVVSSTHRSAAQETSTTEPTPETWRPGQSVPDGYRVHRSKAGLPFVLVGGSIFFVAYLPLLTYGAIGGFVCGVILDPMSESNEGCDPHDPGLQMIPVLGPFLYIHANDASISSSSRTLYTADGVLQATGLGLGAIGAVLFATAPQSLVPETASRKNEPLKLRVLPMIGANANGVTVFGSF